MALQSDDNVLITICVPTYNRGAKAKALVTHTLREIDDLDNVKLLILDNASTEELDEYRDIEEMSRSSDSLDYIRHSENIMGFGNYLACFKQADSSFIMIVSDEDKPQAEFIRAFNNQVTENPKLGVFRGSIAAEPGATKMNAAIYESAKYTAGEAALLHYSLYNNYFSGTIYNRRRLIDLGLVARLENNIASHSEYPHLYLEILVCANSDIETTENICVIEGPPQVLDGPAPSIYLPPYSFGARLDQFIVLRDAFREAIEMMGQESDSALFLTLYLRLCKKYLYLISMINGPMYAKNNIHSKFLAESLLPFFVAAVSMYPEIAGIREVMLTELFKIHKEHMQHFT